MPHSRSNNITEETEEKLTDSDVIVSEKYFGPVSDVMTNDTSG